MRESQALVGQARLLEDGEKTTDVSCYKGEATNGSLPHGMPSPTPVTPKEKEREMAKCLLGLKLLNYIK